MTCHEMCLGVTTLPSNFLAREPTPGLGPYTEGQVTHTILQESSPENLHFHTSTRSLEALLVRSESYSQVPVSLSLASHSHSRDLAAMEGLLPHKDVRKKLIDTVLGRKT